MDESPETPSGGGQPQDAGAFSEEDARRLMDQLRSAPAEQIVADVLSMLLNAAQVKLGRRDARLFIDLSAVLLQGSAAHVSADLRTQAERALGQLRLAQVNAENHSTKSHTTKNNGAEDNGGEDHGPENAEPEQNDLSTVPTPPPASRATQPTQATGPSPASRLWVPGR